MTQEEAIAKARVVAQAQGWPWHESVRATLEDRSYNKTGLLDSLWHIFGGSRLPIEGKRVHKVWQVVSSLSVSEPVLHVPSVIVTIDDETGEALQKFYQPR